MRRRFAGWWPLRRGTGRHSQEPGAALFQGLRIRLTLWYCGVLGAALVLFGVTLYFGAQYSLLTPIENDTAALAYAHVGQWLKESPDHACPISESLHEPDVPRPGQGFTRTEMTICFDQNGSLLPEENTTGLPSAFLSNNLARTVLQTGQPAHDTVNAGGTIGQIYRYARVVPGPNGKGAAGVVMTGEPIQVQKNVLSLLLMLLLSIGGVTLLGAGLGGLFLANRALVPARLSWARQQQFIADASHELRTPLTLLRADAEVLLRGRKHLTPEDADLLEDIVTETSHMTTLANNMLTLARLDNHSVHQEHEIVNLTRVAREGARRIHALAEQKKISIQTEFNENVVVIGDLPLLEQAALALLDNAIKYNRQGGCITLRTTVKDKQALLEVHDTGIGIAPEHLLHLSERFYRVDKARSREAGGTGLGLSIVQGIAAAHSGTLNLRSIPGEGTTVTLTLPLAQETLPDHRHARPQENVSSLPGQTV